MTEQEFNARILPCHRRMYAAALVIVGDSDEASDIVQEAFVRLWERRSQLAKLAQPEGYSLAVVRNLSLDAVRHRQAHPRTEFEGDLMGGDRYGERRAESAEQLTRLQSLMQELPQQQRQVIEMSALGDMDQADIAAATGLSMVNVRTTLSRGRKRLRSLWKASGEV